MLLNRSLTTLPLWPMPGYCFWPTLLGRCPRLSDPAGIVFPAGILFPADHVGTLSLSDHAGILFSAVPAIPFPAGPDQYGTLSPTDPPGILFPADPAGILFPADLAEPVTLDVADSADAGILFPAVAAEILISIDPAGMLLPTDPAEFDTVGVVNVADVGRCFRMFRLCVIALSWLSLLGSVK